MSGNVWEWTRSLYADYPYPRDTIGRSERQSRDNDSSRVLRGGAFYLNPWDVRCACRNYSDPDGRSHGIGFRVVVSPLAVSDR
jgi:formylglycine-generating enzyme required for sulfatase activity